jgi:hypothetical protein
MKVKDKKVKDAKLTSTGLFEGDWAKTVLLVNWFCHPFLLGILESPVSSEGGMAGYKTTKKGQLCTPLPLAVSKE